MLASSSSKMDLRDVKLTINGQAIQLMGRVGLLDTNIFKQSGVNLAALQDRFVKEIVARAAGSTDFLIPIEPSFDPNGHGGPPTGAGRLLPCAGRLSQVLPHLRFPGRSVDLGGSPGRRSDSGVPTCGSEHE